MNQEDQAQSGPPAVPGQPPHPRPLPRAQAFPAQSQLCPAGPVYWDVPLTPCLGPLPPRSPGPSSPPFSIPQGTGSLLKVGAPGQLWTRPPAHTPSTAGWTYSATLTPTAAWCPPASARAHPAMGCCWAVYHPAHCPPSPLPPSPFPAVPSLPAVPLSHRPPLLLSPNVPSGRHSGWAVTMATVTTHPFPRLMGAGAQAEAYLCASPGARGAWQQLPRPRRHMSAVSPAPPRAEVGLLGSTPSQGPTRLP